LKNVVVYDIKYTYIKKDLENFTKTLNLFRHRIFSIQNSRFIFLRFFLPYQSRLRKNVGVNVRVLCIYAMLTDNFLDYNNRNLISTEQSRCTLSFLEKYLIFCYIYDQKLKDLNLSYSNRLKELNPVKLKDELKIKISFIKFTSICLHKVQKSFNRNVGIMKNNVFFTFYFWNKKNILKKNLKENRGTGIYLLIPILKLIHKLKKNNNFHNYLLLKMESYRLKRTLEKIKNHTHQINKNQDNFLFKNIKTGKKRKNETRRFLFIESHQFITLKICEKLFFN